VPTAAAAKILETQLADTTATEAMRASLYIPSERSSIKTAIFIES
jgi:hypothetical protein